MKNTIKTVATHFRFPGCCRLLETAARRLFALDRCERLYANQPKDLRGAAFIERIRRLLSLHSDCEQTQLDRIPVKGGLLVIANHPYGAPEALLLADHLLKIRPDVRILASHFLSDIPQLQELLIPIDPYYDKSMFLDNRLPLYRTLSWLQAGGVLIVFPGSKVSSLQLSRLEVSDPPWSEDLGLLVRRARVPVVPVWFGGSNGPIFQLAGLLHRQLRTALLPRELLNTCHRTFPMRIGRIIPASRLLRFPSDRKLVSYLRQSTYRLGVHYHSGRHAEGSDRLTASARLAPTEKHTQRNAS